MGLVTDNPIAIAAFEGWNDAADAATAALDHLLKVWPSELVRSLDPECYHDFQVNRPTITRGLDGNSSLTWPSTHLWSVDVPGREDKLLVVRGIEPSFQWTKFSADVTGSLTDRGIKTLISLGALLADSPHTRPTPIHVGAEDPGNFPELEIVRSDYEGPIGITGVLAHHASAAGLNSLSVWASVPHYVSQPPNPKATLAILRRLQVILDVPIPLGDLEEDAQAWERGVDELSEADTEIAEYVAKLEEAKDTAELPEASGEAIAREFEQFLKRRGEEPFGKP